MTDTAKYLLPGDNKELLNWPEPAGIELKPDCANARCCSYCQLLLCFKHYMESIKYRQQHWTLLFLKYKIQWSTRNSCVCVCLWFCCSKEKHVTSTLYGKYRLQHQTLLFWNMKSSDQQEHLCVCVCVCGSVIQKRNMLHLNDMGFLLLFVGLFVFLTDKCWHRLTPNLHLFFFSNMVWLA